MRSPMAAGAPVFLVATLGTGAARASAQNLLVNPNSDTDAAGWSLVAGCSWDGTRGTPDPGAVTCTRTTTDSPGGTVAAGATLAAATAKRRSTAA